MKYQSEIRDSQINQLLEKVENKNYGKYLFKLVLRKLRGFSEKEIRFDFPVTALIGPNGGGKTSVLGAAGLAYKEVKPGRFFTKSGVYDDSMLDWSIEYSIIDKSVNANNLIVRSASFKNLRWSRDNILSRNVIIFGVSRTVPANERVELKRCASTTFEVPVDQVQSISNSVVSASQKILGKDIRNYTHLKVDTRGKISLLTGSTSQGVKFSEFHFGAGESSIIRMIMEIEASPDNSMILIEEIENGLHPIATIRMVEYLIEIAERKKVQVIFTTHSNDALLPLPPKAIWSAINGNLIQGKLDVRSLRAITGQVEAQLAIFTEDNFATNWIEACISRDTDIHYNEIEIHGMEGDGTAVSVNKIHNVDPTRRYESICYLDGDSRQATNAVDKVFRLPGESPESYIYDKILDRIDEFAGELTIALHRSYERHTEIAEKIRSVRFTNRDSHLLFAQVGREIGFVSETVVVSAFLNLWAEKYPDEVVEILTPIKANLRR